MRTLKKVPIIPIYLNIFPLKENMEFGKLYISLEYKSTSHLCLCGCGTECHLPINSNGWNFEDKEGKITMNPSILQRFKCRSHYIIKNGYANFV